MARSFVRRPRNLLPVHVQPSSAFIREFLQLARKRRRRVDASLRLVVEKYLDADDARQLRGCMKSLLRFHDERAGKDLIHPRRCKSPWCPWCAPWDHHAKTYYQARKLASLTPAPKAKLRLVNIVWELPQPFHALVRAHEGVQKAWRTAIRRTIAGAYGYVGDSKGRAEKHAWSELGAILNFHAFGDRGTPWPKWFPHYDMLLCGYRKDRDSGTFRKLCRAWPEPYPTTRLRYREELRRALRPLVASGSARSVELLSFLATDFDVIWHVTEAPKGSTNVIQTGARAYKTVA